MHRTRIKGYCAPKCGNEGVGYRDKNGYLVCDCGSKTKFVTLSEPARASLQDFYNGAEGIGVQEIGKILTEEANDA